MGSGSMHAHVWLRGLLLHAHVWLRGLLLSPCSLLCAKCLVVQVTYLEPEVDFSRLVRWVLSVQIVQYA